MADREAARTLRIAHPEAGCSVFWGGGTPCEVMVREYF